MSAEDALHVRAPLHTSEQALAPGCDPRTQKKKEYFRQIFPINKSRRNISKSSSGSWTEL